MKRLLLLIPFLALASTASCTSASKKKAEKDAAIASVRASANRMKGARNEMARPEESDREKTPAPPGDHAALTPHKLSPAAIVSDAPPEDMDDDIQILKKDSAGCSWVDSLATVSFAETDTRHQAKARAVARARARAMQKFLGVTLRHSFVDFQQEGLKGEIGLTQNLLRTTQHGRVLKEKILSHGPADLPDCPACQYKAHIQTCIIPMKATADKDFRVEISLNRSRFVEGDEAEIRITATRDAYIYLYNLDMDWNAAMMFPNVYFKENRIRAGETITYPSPEMRKKSGASVTAQLPEGASVSAELLRVLATKTPLTESILTGGGKSQEYSESETRGNSNFLDLMRRLSASDMEWVDDNVAFTIYKN